MITFNEDLFGTIVLSCVFFAIFIYVLTLVICKRRGINLNENHRELWVLLSLAFIVLLPFWLSSDITIGTKFSITAVALFAGIAKYLAQTSMIDFLKEGRTDINDHPESAEKNRIN